MKRGWSSLLKWSEFETPFKPSMRTHIKASPKFLWDILNKGWGGQNCSEQKVRELETQLCCLLQGLSAMADFSYHTYHKNYLLLHDDSRQSRYVHPFCFLTMAVKSLLILHQMSPCFSLRDAFNKKPAIPFLNLVWRYLLSLLSKSLNTPQDKQISVYNLCPTTSTFLVKFCHRHLYSCHC